MDQLLAMMRARSDQHAAKCRDEVRDLVRAYREAIGLGADRADATALLCFKFANACRDFEGVKALSARLAVAVAMLAEAPETVPGRHVLDEPAVAYDPEDPHKPETGEVR